MEASFHFLVARPLLLGFVAFLHWFLCDHAGVLLHHVSGTAVLNLQSRNTGAGYPLSEVVNAQTNIRLANYYDPSLPLAYNSCNTNDTCYTGCGKLSKIPSKRLFAAKSVKTPTNTHVLKNNYFFGVAIEYFFPAWIKGPKTRLSANNTPLFWTAAGALNSLSTVFDAPSVWCALYPCQRQ